jgi:hypothetical protein
VAQVLKHLPGKQEALSTNHSITKKKKKTRAKRMKNTKEKLKDRQVDVKTVDNTVHQQMHG